MPATDLEWLLTDLVRRVVGIDRAVLLTRDGLLAAASAGLTREDAEHLSAVASAFHSLARGFSNHFGAGLVRKTMVELDSAVLFVIAAGEGSCLAVLASADVDLGLVAYEMAIMVKRFGTHMTTQRRLAGQAAQVR
jgi:predicted regulator of Ras-like GTPase activity (Roadblock/LC7/MglB family)